MEKKPNIILFLADDLGYGDVSAFNPQSKIKTKNIDSVAGQGLKFTDMHAASALCSPSRYSLLTGRYAWRSALKSSVLPGQAPPLIEAGRLTLAQFLKDQGYRTAAVGKWHLGMEWQTREDTRLSINYRDQDLKHWDLGLRYDRPIGKGPVEKGFDYFFGLPASLDQPPFVYIENDRVLEAPDHIFGDDRANHLTPDTKFLSERGPARPGYDPVEVVPECDRRALQLIEEYAGEEEPFFLYIPSPAPHTPIVPAKEFQGKSGIGSYGDFVLQIDDFIGRISGKLRELGIEEDTIFIVTSDNGCSPTSDYPALKALGHHPSYIYRGLKSDIWEGGHRVPFIVSWPGRIESGSVSHRTASLVDLFATLAEITGASYGDDTAEDSFSQSDLWLGGEKYERESLIHHSGVGMYSIRRGEWKLELCPGSGGFSDLLEGEDLAGLPEIQLYNLESDIREHNNVQADQPEVVRVLKTELERSIRQGRTTPGVPQPYTGAECLKDWAGLHWLEAGMIDAEYNGTIDQENKSGKQDGI